MKSRFRYLRKASKNKYSAVRYQGFHSKLEASVYQILLWREKAGEISDIKRQQGVKLGGRYWKCDFSFTDTKTDLIIWCEAKGFMTREWLWIKEMWRLCGPGRLEIWGGSYRRPFKTGVIEFNSLTK